MPLHILICGSGVAGPALAILLLRSNPEHTITIVERSSSLRATGQQIDIRAQGIPIMKKLGLLETIRSRGVRESGVEFVDAQGNSKAMFTVNDSGKGSQSITSEYEIMRGDLVQILYEASLEESKKIERNSSQRGGLTYEFGKYATAFSQESPDEKLKVAFSDGATGTYDLVVGADGQSSRTRRMVFEGEGAPSSLKSLNLFCAFFSIPRVDADGSSAKCFHLPNSRIISTRAGDRRATQVTTGIMTHLNELRESLGKSIPEQKELWAKLYDDCSWQHDRLMDGFRKTDDLYAVEIGQVKMERWSKGRVTLIGDAGYCPSPVSGCGTTASFTGAYVLAGELARHRDDVLAALESYEKVLRPFVTEYQSLPPGVPGLAYPTKQWGITLLQTVLGVVATLRIDKAISYLMPESKGGRELPEYPELHLDV